MRFAEPRLEIVFLAAKLADSLTDEVGLDATLERIELQADTTVEVGDLLAEALVVAGGAALILPLVRSDL